MNVTVIKQDESVIYGGKVYTHGQSFEVDEAIGESLIERGFVNATASDDKHEETQLEDASYTELKKMAASMGLPATGKKDELIARIQNAEAEKTTDEEYDSDELPNTAMPD